ncbi:hypothetical protein O6H91_20G020900 [Diphasiastrum complanatum]|uniref:Uncharacterized protein n=1 Tax=Diphasiastrum complanatum TaxID=34168 RepID=A0ACC2ANH5_DIPCM|nr:hypothetical protein O6H91_20G020900 [Diphasiastrum complanatum]
MDNQRGREGSAGSLFKTQTLLVMFLLCNLLRNGMSSTVTSQTFPKSSRFDEAEWKGEISKHPFGSITRRKLLSCHDENPLIDMSVDPPRSMTNVQEVTVTISGILNPSENDWIAVLSPSSMNYTLCPGAARLYAETGDLAALPLLCHYPVKFQYLKADPAYIPCKKSRCQEFFGEHCLLTTCNGSVTFRLVNIRTDTVFVFFMGGLNIPCVLARSDPFQFENPNAPLYGHLSSIDSSSTSMKLTWVSGDGQSQFVQYADGRIVNSTSTTFDQKDMCDASPSPAVDFGWHDPGYIHSAVMNGLSPQTIYSYRYGSDAVGWSSQMSFSTPPAAGFDKLVFIMYGDMGKAERDGCNEHYIQPGSLKVIDAVAKEVSTGDVDMIYHIGDISYATGFLAEWDFFLEMIGSVASRVPYMTAVGNHERDFPGSGSVYCGLDSGGECGVPYETYFQMPTQGKDKPWYSIEQGPVHFTIMSTEHSWDPQSEQYKWIESDLASVKRQQTPWILFAGHRPQYSSVNQGILAATFVPSVDPAFVAAIEPLLVIGQVDLALWGHVHNYERTCAVNRSLCIQYPKKDDDGIDTYTSNTHIAPVHTVIGMSGFQLDSFRKKDI